MIIFEEFTTLRGNKIKRVKSSVIYLSGFVCLVVGFAFIGNSNDNFVRAGIFLLTAFLVLMLYPTVRLLFGGKDSIGAIVATVVVEEATKHYVIDAIKKAEKKSSDKS